MGRATVKKQITDTKPKKRYGVHALYLLVLLLVTMQVYKKVYDEKLYLGGDNVVYYINAKALMQGEGYTNIHSPANDPANHYPPGYALISAVTMTLFGDDIEVMNKANGFFLFGSLVFFYLIMIRMTGNMHLSFVIALLSGLNFHVLNFAIIAMSEIPFIFTSLAALFFLMRTTRESFSFLKDYNFWLFLFFLILSYFIRTAGIAMIGGVILYFLFERKWKMAGVVLAGFLLFAFPWFLRSSSLGGSSYARQLVLKNPYQPELGKMKTADWFTRIGKNAKRYVSMEIPSALLGYKIENYKEPRPEDKRWITGILFIALGAIGLFRLKAFKWLIIIYMVGTAFIVSLWPDVWFGTRFILPVIPLMFLVVILPLYEGLAWVVQRAGLKENLSFTLLPFVFLAFIPFQKDGITYLETAAKNPMHPNYQRYFELAKYAKVSIPSNAVVVCRKPELFYLYADRKVISYISTTDTDSLINDMQSRGATHVVLEQLGFASTGRYLSPAIQKYPEKFKMIKHLQNPDTYLFEIHYDMGYTGEMKDGKRHGKGLTRHPDGSSYEGEWVDGVKQGTGVFVWANGMRFEGEFSNNLRNGKGVMLLENGNILEGFWVNDTLNGYGKLSTKDGVLIQEGMMKNNTFVQQ